MFFHHTASSLVVLLFFLLLFLTFVLSFHPSSGRPQFYRGIFSVWCTIICASLGLSPNFQSFSFLLSAALSLLLIHSVFISFLPLVLFLSLLQLFLLSTLCLSVNLSSSLLSFCSLPSPSVYKQQSRGLEVLATATATHDSYFQLGLLYLPSLVSSPLLSYPLLYPTSLKANLKFICPSPVTKNTLRPVCHTKPVQQQKSSLSNLTSHYNNSKVHWHMTGMVISGKK